MSALAYHRLPRGWEVRPLKRIAALNPEVLPEDTDPEWTFPYVDIGNVTFEAGITGTELVRFADAPSRARRRVRNGDTIVSTVRTYLRAIAPVWNQPDDLIVSTGFAVIRARPPMDAGYLSWALRSNTFVESVVADSVGVSYPAIAPSVLGSLPVPAPPPAKQHAIADFLERETAKIDALIATQERLIALLDEKRQATITHAVTKGLDPNVPMKESGDEMFPAIPAGWTVKRLKYLAGEVTVGVVVTPSKYYADSGVPALRSLNVRPMEIAKDELVFFDEASNRILAKSMLRAGDLVAVRTGKPGTTAVIGDDLDGANCIDLILIRRSPRFDSRFLGFVLNSDLARAQFTQGSEGALQQHFNIETAKNLLLPVPSRREQADISEYLDNSLRQFDASRGDCERMIDTLRERRTALVTAAVTGQIDVSRAAITEAAE